MELLTLPCESSSFNFRFWPRVILRSEEPGFSALSLESTLSLACTEAKSTLSSVIHSSRRRLTIEN
jgi:hypothetical protein